MKCTHSYGMKSSKLTGFAADIQKMKFAVVHKFCAIRNKQSLDRLIHERKITNEERPKRKRSEQHDDPVLPPPKKAKTHRFVTLAQQTFYFIPKIAQGTYNFFHSRYFHSLPNNPLKDLKITSNEPKKSIPKESPEKKILVKKALPPLDEKIQVKKALPPVSDVINVPENFIPLINNHKVKKIFSNDWTSIVKVKIGEQYGVIKYPVYLDVLCKKGKYALARLSISLMDESVKKEAKAYKIINNEHPNVIKFLHDYDKPTPALLLEFCPTDLLTYTYENDIDVPFVLSLSITITDTLHFIHNKGIIHRDIKPENILISFGKDNNIIFKLCDFGACFFAAFDPEKLYDLGYLPATKGYRAPELDILNPSNHSIDVYAFGITVQKILDLKLQDHKITSQNMKQVKKHIQDTIAEAVQDDIKKRIQAKAWNLYLKEKALPLLV